MLSLIFENRFKKDIKTHIPQIKLSLIKLSIYTWLSSGKLEG
jgi:hypothetical protein